MWHPLSTHPTKRQSSKNLRFLALRAVHWCSAGWETLTSPECVWRLWKSVCEECIAGKTGWLCRSCSPGRVQELCEDLSYPCRTSLCYRQLKHYQGAISVSRCHLTSIGIPIPGKDGLYIEMGPRVWRRCYIGQLRTLSRENVTTFNTGWNIASVWTNHINTRVVEKFCQQICQEQEKNPSALLEVVKPCCHSPVEINVLVLLLNHQSV